MLRQIRPLWFIPFLFALTLIAASPASAQKVQGINTLNTLPESQTLVGRTIEIVLESRIEGSPTRQGARVYTQILNVIDQRTVPNVPSHFSYMLVVKFDYPQSIEEAFALGYDRDLSRWLLLVGNRASSRGESIAHFILH